MADDGRAGLARGVRCVEDVVEVRAMKQNEIQAAPRGRDVSHSRG